MSRRFGWLLGLCMVGFGSLAWAQSSTPDLQPVTEVEGVREYRLANGLQVLLVQDASKPTTTVNLTVRVGSRHESYGETGMAHLLEHLLFKGSARHPDAWAEFSRRGLRANGSTWYDRTNYFASFAANEENLRWYLDWLADAMVNASLERSALDAEMTVVRNEMEMGENDAGRVLLERGLSTMYLWHNYGKSTIGARSDVENVDIEALRRFYRRHYRPDNATLIVSGLFDTRQVLAWIQASFASLPRPAGPLPMPATLDPVQDGEREVVLRRPGGVPLVYAMYHVPPGPHPDHAALQALALILGDSPGGRLHRELVEPSVAAAAFAFTQGLAEPGYALFGVQLAAGGDVSRAQAALLRVVEGLAKAPVTQAELDRAKARWLKQWELGFADAQRVGVALSESIAQGDWRLYFLIRDRVRALRLDDVQRVAQAYLVRDNRTLARYLPTQAPRRAPDPQRVDVAAMLQGYAGEGGQGEIDTFEPTPANIDARTAIHRVGEGLQVALLPKPTRGRLVHARLDLRFGSVASLQGQAEAAAMVAALLDKGTRRLSRQALSDELDRLRADVSVQSLEGGISVSMRTSREQLPALIAVVAQMLREPALEASAFEEVRRQWLAGLEEALRSPQERVDNAVDSHLRPYPRGDIRHLADLMMQRQAVQNLSLRQVRAFHARFYGASHAQFTAVGDLDAQAVLAALQQQLQGWRSNEAQERIPRPLADVPPGELKFVTPDQRNAYLRASQALPLSDTHPDYAAFLVANYLLGQSGSSRLWSRVREREGLSYGIQSYVEWSAWEPNSTWTVSAIFAPENLGRVRQAIEEEVAKALSEGFTAEEVEAARKGLLALRRLGRAQDAQLAAALAENLRLGRRFEVSQAVDERIARLTPEEVHAALRRHLRPDRWVWAVGGDFKD
jgi:zinc protease